MTFLVSKPSRGFCQHVLSTIEHAPTSGIHAGCFLRLEYPLLSYSVASKLHLLQVLVHTFSLSISLGTLLKIAIPSTHIHIPYS